MVRVLHERGRRVPLARAQALHPRERVAPGALQLRGVQQLAEVGVGLDDRDGLLRARALLGREDRALVLVCPPGPVRRALDLTCVSDLFTIYESRDRAATALVPAEPNGAK
jgi:hypothetical protein